MESFSQRDNKGLEGGGGGPVCTGALFSSVDVVTFTVTENS